MGGSEGNICIYTALDLKEEREKYGENPWIIPVLCRANCTYPTPPSSLSNVPVFADAGPSSSW
jgi:hypothetical protein